MDARVKAMVLGAGFGSRLRPITEYWPKPLIPFLGASPLALALARIKLLGIKDVAVNAHYRAGQIETFIEQNPFNLRLHYSFEPEILGTGGCYNPIRDWLGDDHLLVLNGDVVSSIDLERLIQVHFSGDSLATMAMLPKVVSGEQGFHVFGDRVLGFGKKRIPGTMARNFACTQVLSPAFLDRLPREGSFCVIKEGYLPALADQIPMFSLLHKGIWHDLRDPYFYRLAAMDLLHKPDEWRDVGLGEALKSLQVEFRYRPPGAHQGPAFSSGSLALDKLGSNVIAEDNVQLGSHTTITDSVLLPRARIGDHIQAHASVFYEQAILPATD